MTCRVIRPLIPSYTENELNTILVWFIERHAQSCMKCAAEIESYYRMSDWIEEVRQVAKPNCSVSWESLRNRLDTPVYLNNRQNRRASHVLWPLAPVAFGVLVFVLLRFAVGPTPTNIVAIGPTPAPKVVRATPLDFLPSTVNPPVTVKNHNRNHDYTVDNGVSNPSSTNGDVQPKVNRDVPERNANAGSSPLDKVNKASASGFTTSPNAQPLDNKVTEINVNDDASGENGARERDGSEIIWSN